MRPVSALYIAALLALGWSDTEAATLCVNPGGTGGCFSTLQAALDASQKKDVIEIEAGIYPDAARVPERTKLTIRGAGVGVTILEETLTVGTKAKVVLADLTIRNTSFGGIEFEGTARLTLLDSEVRDCLLSGIFFDPGNLTMERSSIRDNGGSGIVGRGRVTVLQSTISGNTGHGIDVRARTKIQIEDSTISGNTGDGVSLKSLNRLVLLGSTIAQNGVGLRVSTASRTKFANSIIADNSFYDCTSYTFKTVHKSKGYTLIENNFCDVQAGPGDILGVDPALDVLADNGGPTQTHALLAGSPAIDTGNPKPPGKGAKCRSEDQRGEPRNGPCDIGAYEF